LDSTLTSSPHSALIPSVTDRPGDDPIFSLNAEARRRAEAGESILNATLGALMTDEGRLHVPPSVAEAYRRIPLERSSAYAPIPGPPAFLAAVKEDVLGETGLLASSTAVATTGGTGAVLHAITTFLDIGQSLLTSSYFWSPYRTIASHTRRGVETFRTFDESGRFDLRSLEERLSAQIADQGRALVILNFPCHNPTGYTLDEQEWAGLVEVFERHAGRAPIAVLFDIAYSKFAAPERGGWARHLERLSGSVQVLVAWSASKSFAQYGARVGALVAVHEDDAELRRISNALGYACRGTWSNCNHLGMLAVTELLTAQDLRAEYARELGDMVGLLARRVEAFNREAEGVDVVYPRYEGGFFVTVFTDSAATMAGRMRELGVYAVPLEGAVRIALCAVPEASIPRLVEALAEGAAAAAGA
jgi:aromatic-amino-acid transaminase